MPTGKGKMTIKDASGLTPGGRKRCKYADKCYQKGTKHRSDFSHPGDQDWIGDDKPTPTPSTDGSAEKVKAPLLEKVEEDSEAVVKAPDKVDGPPGELREERFSLDFFQMTQVNLTRRAGMRIIKRLEGKTCAQK